MFKGILIGMALSTAIVVGLGTYGFRVMENTGKAMQVAFHDDLEAYRACIHNNDHNDARTTVGACMDDLRTWKESPTFKAEWTKLMRMDARVNVIENAYNASQDEDETTLAYGRATVNTCAKAADIQACIAQQYGE